MLTLLDCAEGVRWAALFTAAPGEEIDLNSFSQEHAGRFGEAAAAIHGATDSLTDEFQRAPLDLDLLLNKPLALIRPMIAHRSEDLAYLAALATQLRSNVETAAGLDKGFCHGDLHFQNARYADQVFTVYDFDYCGWGYRAYDLSVFPWTLRDQPPERIAAMARAFLAGYLRHRPANSIDIAAIPTFVAIRQILVAGLHIGLADRFGWGWLNDRYFDRLFKGLRDWQTFLDPAEMDWLAGALP